MGKFFLNFESYLTSPDPTHSFTPKEFDDHSKFKIGKVKAQTQEGGIIIITIPFLDERVIQIMKLGDSAPFIVLGDIFSSRKDAWEFKQELATNSDLKAIMREYNLTDLFHYISVSNFHFIK